MFPLFFPFSGVFPIARNPVSAEKGGSGVEPGGIAARSCPPGAAYAAPDHNTYYLLQNIFFIVNLNFNRTPGFSRRPEAPTGASFVCQAAEKPADGR